MGGAVFAPCCLTWDQTMVEVMKIVVTSFKRSLHALLHWVTPILQQATADPRLHWRLLDMGKSGSVSCGVTAPFSWVLVCTKFCLCLQESVSPVLCKFWWLYGGVNGDILQDGFCHTQVCSIQSPCPCSRPLLIRASAGDPQKASLSQSLWSLLECTRYCLSPPSICFPSPV